LSGSFGDAAVDVLFNGNLAGTLINTNTLNNNGSDWERFSILYQAVSPFTSIQLLGSSLGRDLGIGIDDIRWRQVDPPADGKPVITLVLSTPTVAEDGATNLTYTFSRTGSTSSSLTVNYTVNGSATLGTDYTGISGGGAIKSITFAAGASTATVTVDPKADTTIEADETIALTLATGSAYTIGTPAAVVGTILNDDPRVSLSVSPASVMEDGSANLVFTFSLPSATPTPLTVNYTVGGTATLGTDYAGISSTGTIKTITFAAGATKATVTVDPIADTTIEANETVILNLAPGTGYTVGTTTAVSGTINNDDFPVISLAVSPASVAEDGSGNLIYTFTRTGPTSSALSVNYTVGGTATLGTDYTGISASGTTKRVSIAAGSSTATVIVDPTLDATIEPDETLSLSLASGSGYTIGTTNPVSGIISNDDTTITLYNASATTLPSQQGWLAFGTGLSSTQTRTANGTTLNSTALIEDASGYSNYAPTAANLVKSTFPRLDRATGFSLDFRLQVLSETHEATNRAGFSVILLDQGPTPSGIELGFWTNSIFSQGGGPTPFQTPTGRIDGIDTTTATTYSLRILDQTFYLLAGNRLLLSGSVQDYSQWPKDPLLPYNPYSTPNYLFLGDNTRRASGNVELGNLSLGVARTGGIGNDTLTGTAAADSLNGLEGADQLSGNGGSDWLAGGAGADTLNGGPGDDLLIGGSHGDLFLFGSGASFDVNQLGVDTIVDFSAAEDRLRLERATFTALTLGATLSASAFAVVSSDAEAATSGATIIYNGLSGGLFYNANGSDSGFAGTTAGGGKFAQLWGGASGAPFPSLTSAIFELV
jgi:Ca2+-binding RTX toxin-like protein